LRDRLLGRLRALPHVHVHGSMAHRLPGNLSIAFDFVEARALLGVLEPFVSLSAGSACTATSLSPSHVLSALGVPRDRAQSTVRIGVGRFTTSEEIDQTAALLEQHVARLRDESPIWRAMGPQAANRSTTHA
jgi:cysteine desulfurase